MTGPRRWFLAWLWILTSLGSLVGCSGVNPSASRPSGPFFLPTAEDASHLEMLKHRLHAQAFRCVEAANCDQVSFATALLSLFESQDAARVSFREVIEHDAASRLADSSRLWLRIIDEHEPQPIDIKAMPWTEMLAQFVREWMDRQLAEQPTIAQPVSPVTNQDLTIEQSRVVRELRKQLRQRDRQIFVLQSQLEALRLIDEDHVERKRQPRIPATLHPQGRLSAE